MKVDKISVITQKFKEYLVREGVDPIKVVVIEDSIDTDLFCPTPMTTDEFSVIHHGVESVVKDTELVLRVMKGNGISFTFVGNHRKADFWGEYQDMPVYICSNDVGVVARKNNLANNLVVSTGLLQYMSCGRCVIAPRLDAIEDVVKDGVEGYLYNPSDRSSLRLAIETAKANKPNLHKMGQAGREKAVKRFNVKLIGRKMYDFVTT
jgi:glycosyltransferase involved in cell wall biosynthesis